MAYLFSSESVSEGHPDKVADQISDAILDQFLAYDPTARVACETFVTTGQVVIMGEVRSEVYIDLQTIARNTIKRIGYTKAEYQFDGDSCGILTAIHEQSSDINQGVERAAAEDHAQLDFAHRSFPPGFSQYTEIIKSLNIMWKLDNGDGIIVA